MAAKLPAYMKIATVTLTIDKATAPMGVTHQDAMKAAEAAFPELELRSATDSPKSFRLTFGKPGRR